MLRDYKLAQIHFFSYHGDPNNRFSHLCLNLLLITTIAGVATMIALIGVFLIT